jgi:hypothetical protein
MERQQRTVLLAERRNDMREIKEAGYEANLVMIMSAAPLVTQTTRQLLFDFFLFRLRRAARVACWKTSLTPSPVLAEHSK